MEPKNLEGRGGEFVWRSVRYAAAVAAGYACGLTVGSAAKGPAFWVVAAVGLLGIFWVFRTGKKSVQHAASDAVASARASAAATASSVSSNHVQIGHSYTVSEPGVENTALAGVQRVVPFSSPLTPEQLPPGVYDSADVWNDYHEQFDNEQEQTIDWDAK